MKYSVIHLQSVPICVPAEEYKIDDKILKFINTLEFNTRYEGQGARSKNSYILKSKELLGLKKFIEKYIDFYAYDLLKISRKHKFYITQSWFNINRKGENHPHHSHPNSFISGVFYVAGDDCPIWFSNGDNVFGNSFEVNIEEFNQYSAKFWWVPNENFKLILFPSYLEHFVESNESDTPRISLSMNTFIKGNIGDKDNLTEVFFK